MTAATFIACLLLQRSQGFDPDYLDPDGWGRLGFALLEGKGLIDDQGMPSAMRGPVVPLVFAAMAGLFGQTYEVLLATQAIFYALAGGLVGLFASLVFGRARVTLVAMLMHLAFVPAHPWMQHIFSEPIFTTVLAGFVLVWVLALEKQSGGWWFAAGISAALAALARPVL